MATQSEFQVIIDSIQSEGIAINEAPIKELKKKLKNACSEFGIEDEKELLSIVSKMRRREKKVKYSAEERKRNNTFMKTIEQDVWRLNEVFEYLQHEKSELEREIQFYKQELDKQEIFPENNYYEEYLSPDFFALLEQDF